MTYIQNAFLFFATQINLRPAGGGGVWTPPPPSGFSRIEKKRRVFDEKKAAGFSPTLPPIFPAIFVKI